MKCHFCCSKKIHWISENFIYIVDLARWNMRVAQWHEHSRFCLFCACGRYICIPHTPMALEELLRRGWVSARAGCWVDVVVDLARRNVRGIACSVDRALAFLSPRVHVCVYMSNLHTRMALEELLRRGWESMRAWCWIGVQVIAILAKFALQCLTC